MRVGPNTKTIIAKDRLREVMTELDITSKEIADEIGICTMTMVNVLKKKGLRPYTASEIARYLDMNQAELFESVVIENN